MIDVVSVQLRLKKRLKRKKLTQRIIMSPSCEVLLFFVNSRHREGPYAILCSRFSMQKYVFLLIRDMVTW